MERQIAEDIKALKELIVLCAKDFVQTRFHGMRKLSAEYSSPTLGMFLEVGLRTPEVNSAWNLFHQLQQFAAWKAAGVFLKAREAAHERHCQETIGDHTLSSSSVLRVHEAGK